MKYSHKNEELKNGEFRISESRLHSIIITKEMIPWIINTLRGASFEDYNNENFKIQKEFDKTVIMLNTDFFVERTPYSYIEIYTYWGKNNPKNSAPIIIPYTRQFKELTMSEFIEPFLCDLEKYLSKEGENTLSKQKKTIY